MMSKRMFVISIIVIGLLINGFSFAVRANPSYENYTTYDEVDEDDDITVATNQLTIDTMRNDAVSHVTDDKGVNHFGDFEHLVDVKPISFGTRGNVIVWGISDNYFTWIDMVNNDEGIVVAVGLTTTGETRITLRDNTNANDDIFTPWVVDTFYYLTIKRVGTTTTCKIYSDSGRTNEIDTLTITSTDATYKRIIAYGSMNYVTHPDILSTINIYNLDLQEPSLTISNPYPENNSVDICPCIDYTSIDIDYVNNMNLSFYHSIGDTSDFHIMEKYYNLTSGTYSFCMCGHSFVPAYIYQYTEEEVGITPDVWQDIAFENKADVIKNINHIWYIAPCISAIFNILYDGVYRLAYRMSFEDTAVAPTSESYGRIVVNDIEVAGTLQMKGMFNKNEISSVSVHVMTYLYAGDKVKLQFAGDSDTIVLTSHVQYGDIPNSAILNINRIDDADLHPMHYNETYYWYVNLSEYGNPSNYNVSEIYKFTTVTDASDCEVLSESKADKLFLSSALSFTDPSMLFILWMFLIVLGEWKRDMLYKTLQIPLGVFYGVTLLNSEMWLGLIMICVSIYIGAISLWSYRKE